MASSSTIRNKKWIQMKLVESSHVLTLSKYSLLDKYEPSESIIQVFSTDTSSNKSLNWVWKIQHLEENESYLDDARVFRRRKCCDYLSVYLHLENGADMDDGEFYNVNIAVSILDQDGKLFHKEQNQYLFHKEMREFKFGWRKYYKKQDILNFNPDFLMPKGQVKILCEIRFWDPLPCENIPFPVTDGLKNFKSNKLSDHLGALLNSDNPPKFTDVTLCIGEETEIAAHKFMLAARSQVFAAMFECDMLEKKENKVEIKDMDPQILREMLDFIYTGKASNIEETAQELLAAADLYSIDDLKALAESTLVSKLSITNATDFLMLADTYSAKTLENEAAKFIATNISSVVKMAESWRKMVEQKPQLLALIMESVAEQSKA